MQDLSAATCLLDGPFRNTFVIRRVTSWLDRTFPSLHSLDPPLELHCDSSLCARRTPYTTSSSESPFAASALHTSAMTAFRTLDQGPTQHPTIIDEIRSGRFDWIQDAAQSRPGRQSPTTIFMEDWKGLTQKLSHCSGLGSYPEHKERFKLLSTPLPRGRAIGMPFGNHFLAVEHIIEGLILATEILALRGENRSPSLVKHAQSLASSSSASEATDPERLDPYSQQLLQSYQVTCQRKLAKIDPDRYALLLQYIICGSDPQAGG